MLDSTVVCRRALGCEWGGYKNRTTTSFSRGYKGRSRSYNPFKEGMKSKEALLTHSKKKKKKKKYR